MQCVTPIKLSDKKIAVPCGHCFACKRNYQMNWIIRLKEELKDSKNCYFVTLTYNEKHIPTDSKGNTYVSKSDVQKFMKRLRKRIGSSEEIKYYLSSEYGPNTFRPHYHAVIFNLPVADNVQAKRLISKAWSIDGDSLGFVEVDEVNEARIAYVTGYCMDKYKETKSGKKVFSLMSKGLGASYLKRIERICWHKDFPLENMYYPLENGKKIALPRYYREKIINSSITKEVIRGISEKSKLLEWYKNKEEISEQFQKTVDKNNQLEKRYLKNKKLRKL